MESDFNTERVATGVVDKSFYKPNYCYIPIVMYFF